MAEQTEPRDQPLASRATLEPTSAQLQEAINQLSHLQHILVGDNGMTLDGLLSAAAATGGTAQGVPEGGLLHALPRLLAPLLPLGGKTVGNNVANQLTGGQTMLSQQQMTTLLARQAAFQPRQYVALSNELIARTRQGSGSAGPAVDLYRQLESSEAGPSKPKIPIRQRVLEQRKRKRDTMQQMGGMTFRDSVKAQQKLVDDGRKGKRGNEPASAPIQAPGSRRHLFVGEARARTQGVGVSEKGAPTTARLQEYLDNWHAILSKVDYEAARAVVVDIDGPGSQASALRWRLRVDIASVGSVALSISFSRQDDAEQKSYKCRIETLNVRSESEVFKVGSTVTASNLPDSSPAPSAFPLYRRLSAAALAKASATQAPQDHPWHPLASMMFALAGLSHLHEREALLQQGLTGTASAATDSSQNITRGTTALLDALDRWDPNAHSDGMRASNSIQFAVGDNVAKSTTRRSTSGDESDRHVSLKGSEAAQSMDRGLPADTISGIQPLGSTVGQADVAMRDEISAGPIPSRQDEKDEAQAKSTDPRSAGDEEEPDDDLGLDLEDVEVGE